jgi:acetyl-CoA acetyltransferase
VTRRFPARDQVAIVGIGTTAFRRESGRSELSLVVEACQKAIRDAGLTKNDIDGLSGDMMRNDVVQSALGIPVTNWAVSCLTAFNMQLTNAVMAVASGVSDTVLVYHSMYRTPNLSASAASDPFRRRAQEFIGRRRPPTYWPEGISGEVSVYAPWARRYFEDYKAGREHLGYIAVNNRTHAVQNEHAAVRSPLKLNEYLEASVLWEPLSLLDIELPIDGADAMVVTTAERARDLPHRPVLIHAAVAGQTDRTAEENLLDLEHTGQRVAVDRLWSTSDLTLDDVDLFYPFDGFSIIALTWFEEVGFCGRGEAPALLEDSWDEARRHLVVGRRRVLVNTHGGNLSEGASQGSGHVREAVTQLRGAAGPRQVPGVVTALVTPGGFFYTPGAILLRT